MATIAELAEDRTVEGVFAVTHRGAAPHTYRCCVSRARAGRRERPRRGQVWNDVDLLDRRFEEGDAVHVLGRVELRRQPQVQVRAVEPAEDADRPPPPSQGRRRADGSSTRPEISHSGLAALADSFVRDRAIRASLRALPAAGGDGHHGCGRPPRAHGGSRDAVSRDGAAPSASRAPISSSPRRSSTTSAALELTRGPSFRRPTRPSARPRLPRPADDRGTRT